MSSFKQTFVSFILIVPLIICALMLVSSQNKYRKLFIELEKENVSAKQMNIEYSQLELQQSMLAKQMRVANKAKENLEMVSVTPARIDYVSLVAPK